MSQKSYLGKIWFSIILSLAGILILGFTILKFKITLTDGIRNSEVASFNRATFLLKEKVDSFIHGLQGMGGVYFSTQFNPHPKLIREYAVFRNFFDNFPGALGYGFIRKVDNKLLPAYISKRQSMDPAFNFKQLMKSDYPSAFIIEVVEPLEKNRPALGVNIGSESHRRQIAEFAMDSGEPTLTAPIKLIQKTSEGQGFIYYLPVYSQAQVPHSLAERREKLVGWAFAPIHFSGLFDFLESSIDSSLVLELKDSEGQWILNPNDVVDSRYENEKYWMQDSLKMGGRTWIVRGAVIPNKNIFLLNVLSYLIFLIASGVYVSLIWKLRREVRQKEVSEDRRHEIESWQSAVLNGSPYPIISTYPDGRITTFNKAAEKMLGYRAEEIIGTIGHEKIHDPEEIKQRAFDLANAVHRPIPVGFDTFTNIIEEDGVNTNEWTYFHKDGTRIPVRLCITSFMNDENKVIGYLGVAEDLREIKKIQALNELQRVTMISNAKMAALGEMAGGMAHEINNPLAIISGHTMILRKMQTFGELDDTSLGNSLLKIDDTCQRIAKIVKGLRAFSRDTANDPKVEISIYKIIEDTLDLCQQRLTNNSIKLTIDIKNEFNILCRPVQITQVLLNLLNNAMDAINHQKDKWIKIKVQTLGEKLIVTVTDSGNGINASVVDRMMEPFFTTKDPGKGTGLGLSISKGIIEDHGGHLRYETYQGHTQFQIELPVS